MASADDRFGRWLALAQERYLADLTRAELGRALRALSSCYVERRRIGEGRALEGRGKRAAFALYYAPLHFLLVREVARSLLDPTEPGQARRPSIPPRPVVDLGCGTGAAGAAWASVSGAAVTGVDLNPWALQEAVWTWRTLGVAGQTRRGTVADVRLPSRPSTLLAAFVINELPAPDRDRARDRLAAAAEGGHQVVIVEPVARSLTPWWRDWERAFSPSGGRTREWRVRVELPPLLRDLDRSAGLDHRELTAKTLVAGF